MLEQTHHFCNAVFQGLLLLNGSEVANHLAAQGGGHLAEDGLRFGRIAQGEDQCRRQSGFARSVVALESDLQNRSGVDFQFFSNITVDGQAIATLAPGDKRGLRWNPLDFSAHRHVRRAVAKRDGDVFGHVHEPNDTDFVDLGGEDVDAIHAWES